MTDTIVERIFKQVKRKLVLLNENGVQFAQVERRELDHDEKWKGHAVSVLDYGIRYEMQTSYLQGLLTLALEIKYKAKLGEEPQECYNRVRGVLHKCLAGTDLNLAETDDAGTPNGSQLTDNITILQDEPDIGNSNADVISGLFQFQIIFRTNKYDPYAII